MVSEEKERRERKAIDAAAAAVAQQQEQQQQEQQQQQPKKDKSSKKADKKKKKEGAGSLSEESVVPVTAATAAAAAAVPVAGSSANSQNPSRRASNASRGSRVSASAASAASASAVAGADSPAEVQPEVVVEIDEVEQIHPEDSASMAGARDSADAALMPAAAAAAPAGNLLAVDSASRESMMSNVSETEESYGRAAVGGEVTLCLSYDYKAARLTITVVQCRNLASVDNSPPNPYVKTYLLPDKTKRSKRRTQTRRATSNPIYSQALVYEIAKSDLETRCLQVSVWHAVTLGSNAFMGEVCIPMDVYRFSKDKEKETHALHEKTEAPVPLPNLMYRGDILLSLRFAPANSLRANQLKEGVEVEQKANGRLEVWVQSCKNLAASGADAAPYVKGYLLPDRSVRSKQKSAIVKGDVNPNFNSILSFENVSLEALKQRSLELTVWDYVRFGSNDFLGGVRLNLGVAIDGHQWMDAKGHEAMMWRKMLENPTKWIEGSLLLRPNMDPMPGGPA